jgi:hypothetical protein
MAQRFAFALVLAAALTISASASAQDVAAAEALFNKGVADMTAGRLEKACPALAESQRLDPRPGTLFTLAECHAKAGKIATALTVYEDYQRSVASQKPAIRHKHAARVKIAVAQIDKLRPEIPTLTLSLPPSPPSGTHVRRDGTELSAAALGIALPVDPGDHVVVVESPGRRPWEQRITLRRGEKKTVELQIGGALGAAEPDKPADAPDPAGKAPRSNGQRIAGYVVGGVGSATLVMGFVMGGLTLAKKATISDNCDGTKCNHEGKLAADSAKTTGLVSTIGFGVGLAGLAAGTVLLLTAPKKSDDKPVQVTLLDAGPSGLSLGVKGVWR